MPANLVNGVFYKFNRQEDGKKDFFIDREIGQKVFVGGTRVEITGRRNGELDTATWKEREGCNQDPESCSALSRESGICNTQQVTPWQGPRWAQTYCGKTEQGEQNLAHVQSQRVEKR